MVSYPTNNDSLTSLLCEVDKTRLVSQNVLTFESKLNTLFPFGEIIRKKSGPVKFIYLSKDTKYTIKIVWIAFKFRTVANWNYCVNFHNSIFSFQYVWFSWFKITTLNNTSYVFIDISLPLYEKSRLHFLWEWYHLLLCTNQHSQDFNVFIKF